MKGPSLPPLWQPSFSLRVGARLSGTLLSATLDEKGREEGIGGWGDHLWDGNEKLCSSLVGFCRHTFVLSSARDFRLLGIFVCFLRCPRNRGLGSGLKKCCHGLISFCNCFIYVYSKVYAQSGTISALGLTCFATDTFYKYYTEVNVYGYFPNINGFS